MTIYSIQYLRGIAALMVVLHHTVHKGSQYGNSTLSWFNIGSAGVDLFFIISGFIMCYTTHNKKISPYIFLKHRIKRIIPLYWFFTTVALIIFLIIPQYVNSSGGNTGILASFLLIPTGEKFLVNNGWTLSYEFYFYFIFSLFIFLNNNKTLRYINISLFILLLYITGLILKPDNSYLKFIFSSLLMEFALGIFSYFIYKRVKIPKIISIIFIFSSIFWFTHIIKSGNIFNNFLNHAIPMFLLFNGFLHLESYFREQKTLINKFFEKLGESSYSLYLVHPFILSIITMIFEYFDLINSNFFIILLVIISIISGWITYNRIEKKIASLLK